MVGCGITHASKIVDKLKVCIGSCEPRLICYDESFSLFMKHESSEETHETDISRHELMEKAHDVKQFVNHHRVFSGLMTSGC